MSRLKFVLSVAIVSLLLSGTMAVGGGWIGSGDIMDGRVLENDIGKMAVTKTKIKTGAVNKYKIKSGAVNTYKILDGSVKMQDLDPDIAAFLIEVDRWATAQSDWSLAMIEWNLDLEERITALEGGSIQSLKSPPVRPIAPIFNP